MYYFLLVFFFSFTIRQFIIGDIYLFLVISVKKTTLLKAWAIRITWCHCRKYAIAGEFNFIQMRGYNVNLPEPKDCTYLV